MRPWLIVARVCIFFGAAACAYAGECGRYAVEDMRGRFEIARPKGFVDVCADRSVQCLALTRGFPATVQTVAYFVLESEAQRVTGEPLEIGLSRYYIAQVSRQSAPKDFEAIKRAIRERNGKIADSSKLPAEFGTSRSTSLGVLDEGGNFISIGAVVRQDSAAKIGRPVFSVATNSAVASNGRVFSLYVYDEYRDEASIARARELTRRWVACFTEGTPE